MEKEIEQLIRTAMYEKLAGGTAHAMEPIVQAAARAIAKWMREGVVWEGVETAYLTEADGDTPETMWLEPAEGGDGPIIEMYGDPQGIEDGQLYLVTFRKVEGGSG